MKGESERCVIPLVSCCCIVGSWRSVLLLVLVAALGAAVVVCGICLPFAWLVRSSLGYWTMKQHMGHAAVLSKSVLKGFGLLAHGALGVAARRWWAGALWSSWESQEGLGVSLIFVTLHPVFVVYLHVFILLFGLCFIPFFFSLWLALFSFIWDRLWSSRFIWSNYCHLV